jgi:prepilin-type N-terminal cleavage/methylation domain-containing protein
MQTNRQKQNQQSGFTVVELMIATLVFSVIMLVIVVGVLQFTRSYYKGITSSSTQNIARSVIDEISQGIQLSGDTIQVVPATAAGEGAVCVGTKQYSYRLGKQLNPAPTTGDQSATALYLTTMTSTCTVTFTGGKELLAKNMRLAAFEVSQPVAGSSLWRLDIRVAYGDIDLLCDSVNVTGSCADGAATLSVAQVRSNALICKTGNASQFCAVSALSTTVQKRLTE